MSLEGQGEPETAIRGTIFGIRTGAVLSDLTVTGGTFGGLLISAGEAPQVHRVTISGNLAADGGGVYCGEGSSPTLTGCTISGNRTWGDWRNGGGVCCDEGSSPILTDCTVTGNWGYNGGGVCCRQGSSPTLVHCTISGNSADNSGGGVHCYPGATPTLASSIVWGNAGGSIAVWGDSLPQVSYSCIESEEVWPGEGNITDDPLFCGWGGRAEVYVDGASPGPGDGSWDHPFSDLATALSRYGLGLASTSPCIGAGEGNLDMGADTGVCGTAGEASLLIHLAPGSYESTSGVNLARNVSLDGAGKTRTVIRGTIYGVRTGTRLAHLAVTAGAWGGVRTGCGEAAELCDLTISGNSSTGVYIEGSTSVVDCRIEKNVETGVYSSGDSPALVNCTISGNGGRGVSCSGSTTVTGCTIEGNRGGGVYCYGSPTLIGCAISGNGPSVYNDGGAGVYCRGSPTLVNCTISGNSIESTVFGGGGLKCDRDASATVINCTITGNSADVGGGGVACGESTTLVNSIVWGNTPESIGGSQVSHCLTDRDPLFLEPGVFDFSRYFTVDIGGAELRLPNFIVEEPDYHLRPGSPAIDQGTFEGAPGTDINGRGRPCGAGVDIGAYEAGNCPPPGRFIRGDVDGSGELGLPDAMAVLLYVFATPRPDVACVKAADYDDDGHLGLRDVMALLVLLFADGGDPPLPYPGCGIDRTMDDLPCDESTPFCSRAE